MKKVYLVEEYSEEWGMSITVAAFSDREEANKYIESVDEPGSQYKYFISSTGLYDSLKELINDIDCY